MRISFSSVRSDQPASYAFDGEKVTVSCAGEEEVFDFGGLPDGEAESIDKGSLPKPCVMRAKREDGELTVMLLLTHGAEAPEEVRFPQGPYTVEEAEALLAQAYPDEVEEEEVPVDG